MWIQDEGKLNEDTYLIDSLLFGTEKSMASYLIKGSEKNVLIDASGKSEGRRIARKLKKMDLIPDILITTHSHWDHAGGVSSIIKKFPSIEVMAHESGLDALANPNDFNKWFPTYAKNLKSVEDVIPLKDGDIIDLGNLELEVISTPGHTNCSICLLDKKNNSLFTGDSIGYKLNEEILFGPIMPPEFSEKKLLNTFEKLNSKEFSSVFMAHFGLLKGELASKLIDMAKSNYFLWKKFILNNWKENADPDSMEEKLRKELIKKSLGSEKAELVAEMFSDWFINGLREANMI
ncbi:MAG: MBL fold metallo-hydrolase [Promethearchaeota archaeon]|nr:MAG: MBL fold metallo-hydrolase [Candidatus Lokiarchaeota archaeon]